jgi:hypothetical protein
MRRREFLKVGGLGLAAFASPSISASLARTDGTQWQQAPVHPVVLKSPHLRVVLDPSNGLPYEYELAGAGTIRGNAFAATMNAVLFDHATGTTTNLALHSPLKLVSPTQVDFRFQSTIDAKPAADFVIRYRVDGPTVFITLEDVQEHPGYELIEIQMPSLATVNEADASAWLAHGDTGGSVADLRNAKPGQLQPNTFWGDVMATMPITMIGDSKITCVQEVTAFMDGSVLSVRGEFGAKSASLGTVKKYRVNGSQCYDMNLGTGAPRNCGKGRTPNLLIRQTSSTRLDFLAASTQSDVESWLAAAKTVRDRMPPTKTKYYDDKFVYGIHCDEPKYEKPRASFKQCEDLIRKVAMLTAGAPQVVHLWGWQYRGKDTGYPAVAQVNERLGGFDALKELMKRGRELNANVTFSDNYDDAYRSSPAWDPLVIARRPDGELWESRNWTGENSYIVGLAKYMAGPGTERVRYTCDRYQLRETTHIDVLSYFSIRDDWDPSHPASGVKNLVEGRYRVLEEFAKRGVDVSSEAMRYAFIGKISLFWHMPRPEPCPFGGKPIPLMAAIYRHSAIWGEWGRNDTPDRVLNCLFYSNSPHAIVETDVNFDSVLDSFYLLRLPWSKLHRLRVESFRRVGKRSIIGVESGSSIDLDWENNTYKAMVNGVEIAETGSTFCPLDERRIAFYSTESRELSVPVPKGWVAANMRAKNLFNDKAEPTGFAVRADRVIVHVRPRIPTIVYRDGESAAAADWISENVDSGWRS